MRLFSKASGIFLGVYFSADREARAGAGPEGTCRLPFGNERAVTNFLRAARLPMLTPSDFHPAIGSSHVGRPLASS